MFSTRNALAEFTKIEGSLLSGIKKTQSKTEKNYEKRI
uniref:Uncharacterized protein n=1 Tax=Unknown prokaryotic organism TaxID=2725 RepID=A0A0F7YX24_UNKP|nr:hypothetical protein [unidentified prokaryotic organism]